MTARSIFHLRAFALDVLPLVKHSSPGIPMTPSFPFLKSSLKCPRLARHPLTTTFNITTLPFLRPFLCSVFLGSLPYTSPPAPFHSLTHPATGRGHLPTLARLTPPVLVSSQPAQCPCGCPPLISCGCCNKPQTWWLKTEIYSLTPRRLEVQIWLHRARVKVWARLHSFWRL